jgi:hypothetical protein
MFVVIACKAADAMGGGAQDADDIGGFLQILFRHRRQRGPEQDPQIPRGGLEALRGSPG